MTSARFLNNAIVFSLIVCAAAAHAATPESIYRDAKRYEEAGDFTRAIESYREFLNEYPDHSQVTEARYRLARSQDAIGLIDEAIANLDTVVKKGNDRFRKRQDAMFLLGKLLGDVARYDDATRIFESFLAEGAGLFHEDVLNRLGGYYAVQEKYDDAAAKFNILKRRRNSKYAEQSAYKLAMIWIRAGNLDLAVDAVSDLATRWPQNADARGLMLQIADKFREQRKFDQAVAACAQLRGSFGKTREGQAAVYILALVHRDRGELEEAAQAFFEAAGLPENQKSGVAAEAMLQAADLYYGKLQDVARAMELYEQTTTLARHDVSERHRKILEQCYFRLGEHHFAQKEWAVALEFYSLLRELGTDVNILPRIMKCQAELGVDLSAEVRNEKEIEFIRQKIRENAGTFAAAEGEVFLLDRELEERWTVQFNIEDLLERYRAVLARYSKEILAQEHLESYIYTQIGRCYSKLYRDRLIEGGADLEWRLAITTLEKALEVDPETPYRIEVLESIASIADLAGRTLRAFEAYRDLYTIMRETPDATNTASAGAATMTDYLRSMLTRADEGDSISKALATAQEIIAKQGKDSTEARHAAYYIGDLYYIKKDFSNAVKAYREFIKTYGPPQTPQGDVAGGAWNPPRVDETVSQVFDAALRVAHCWYLQGHGQNMVKAYEWIVRNFPHKNMSVGEAEYWLAMELARGEAAKSRENRQKLAERLWKRVVNPSMDFESRDFEKSYYPWTRDARTKEYAQVAMLKCGELYSGLNRRRLAADIFRHYLTRYPPGRSGSSGMLTRDEELHGIARYALGREYIALREFSLMIDTYRPYADGMRNDPLRVSALKLLGYHSARNDAYDDGIKAYATLLDEYGRNAKGADGSAVPLPRKQWLRKSNPGWRGIRMAPSEDLDLGAMRYALGFIYWKLEEWDHAIRVLEPFISDHDLRDNKARAKSLHMVGRCFYRRHDYARAFDSFARVANYPAYDAFEAIEEAYVYAARAATELGKWPELHELYAKFGKKYPNSLQRPHMDLYEAAALLLDGHAVESLPMLGAISRSDTYQDVKADALYYLGYHKMTKIQEDYKAAMQFYDESIRLYPRELSCVTAARCAIHLRNWTRAEILLERALRDFPAGKPGVLKEAGKLLPTVKKELARRE